MNKQGVVDAGIGVASSAPSSCLLPGKVIKLRPTHIGHKVRIKGDDYKRVASEKIMLTGTSRSVICPEATDGRLKDPFLYVDSQGTLIDHTAWRHELETLLGVSLDINKKDCYLRSEDLRMTLYKVTDDIENCYIELELGNPLDFIKYQIALIAPEVAKKEADLYLPYELFYIDNAEETLEETIKINDMEDICFIFLQGIKGKRNALYNLLRLYTYTYKYRIMFTRDLLAEKLYDLCKELMRDLQTMRKLYNLIIDIKEDDTKYQTRNLVLNSMEIGEIKYNDNYREFKIVADNEVIGKSLDDAVAYLRNPVNQPKVLRLQQSVSAALKINKA